MDDDKFSIFDMFDAQRRLVNFEDTLFCKVCDILNVPSATLDDIGFSDVTYDDYDTSIELTDCVDDLRLSSEQQQKLWELGFQRCWLNHRNGTETYYSNQRSNNVR